MQRYLQQPIVVIAIGAVPSGNLNNISAVGRANENRQADHIPPLVLQQTPSAVHFSQVHLMRKQARTDIESAAIAARFDMLQPSRLMASIAMNTGNSPQTLVTEIVIDTGQAADANTLSSSDGVTTGPLKRIELVSIWSFWVFIALLTFVNTLINDDSNSGARLPAVAPLIAALIESLIWAMLTPLIFRLTRQFNLDHPKWLLSLGLFLALGLMISVGMAEFMTYVRQQQAILLLPGPPHDGSSPGIAPVARSFWFINEFVIYLAALAAGFAHDYFSRYRTRNEQAAALRAQAALLRAELSDSRLNALRSQLNPHFLFNTLNSISALVGRNPRGARRMIACLSELLRDTLEGEDLEVSLEQELAFIRRYIDIMKNRFHERLIISETIDANTLTAKVPRLILQPLVENAIKHGIEKMDGIGNISINSIRHEDMLVLTIRDNGNVTPNARLSEINDGFGIGLKNTKARLQQSYGAQQRLTLSVHPDGGVVATVALPYYIDRWSLI